MNKMMVDIVRSNQVDEAFGVLRRVAKWLKEKGRRQRISKTSFATYQKWQEEGVNYLVLEGKQIAGVFSLPREPFAEWPTLGIPGSVVWLRSLATDPAHRHKGVGACAIRSALQTVGPKNILYLDCVSDFLPDYYQSHGFEVVAEQSRSYPDEDSPIDITLLKHSNAS